MSDPKPVPLKILILEDNPDAVEALRSSLSRHFAGAQLTIHEDLSRMAELSHESPDRFDVILLDYYCGSDTFMRMPLSHFGMHKVIGISSTHHANQIILDAGAQAVVPKTLRDLSSFSEAVAKEIDRILPKELPRRTDGFASASEEIKKERERALIEKFLAREPDFDGFTFFAYDENPDLIYMKGDDQLGFETVIVALDHATVDCYFDAAHCTLTSPPPEDAATLEKLKAALTEHVLDHLRAYKIPTIIVLTVVGSQIPLAKLAENLALPVLVTHNIQAYYLTNNQVVYKVHTTPPIA